MSSPRLRRLEHKLDQHLRRYGLSFRAVRHHVRGMPTYRSNRRSFSRMMTVKDREEFPFGTNYPCPADRGSQAGTARGHYFHQGLVVAQRLVALSPERVLDVGSRVDGFVAHVATTRPITVADIRPLTTSANNITFVQADFASPNGVSSIGEFDCVTSLHAIEHFGLGRYGDQLDPNGWRTGLENLVSCTSPGGNLFVSVPIGPQRIEFDGQRVFSVTFFRDELLRFGEIVWFGYVSDDAGALVIEADPFSSFADESFGCSYGCGIFQLRKDPRD